MTEESKAAGASIDRRIEQLAPQRRAALEKLIEAEKARNARVPPARRQSTEPLVLSYAQQRLWFLDQLAPGLAVYNIPSTIRFDTSIDRRLLERSLNEIVRRHEILRTTYAAVDGQPRQVITATLHVPVSEIDLRAVRAEVREREALRILSEEAARPFDLASGPLIRACLVTLADADHVFLLTMHHIVTDGWSMTILFDELTALYTAFAAGRASPLPALAIQYADFAIWQRKWLHGERLEKQVAYWRRQLDRLPMLQLPTDRPRRPIATFHGARHAMDFGAPLALALKRFSQRHGVTLFMTLLAAFCTLLHRYTQSDDIVVGSPIAGRNRPEIERLIGFFVNMLVLRTDLSGDPPFAELLQRVRGVAVDAYAHDDVPFEMLVERLQPDRDLSRNPMFQVMLQLQSAPASRRDAASTRSTALDVKPRTAIFDLAVNLWERPDALVGEIEFDTDLFDGRTIERMASHFRNLLEAIVADPDRRLSALPLLSADERDRYLVQWNETAAPFAQHACIHHLFEAHAERAPEAIAVIYAEERISYRELNRRANQLAHHLLGLGVGVETPVGICIHRSVEMVVAWLAVLKAGAAYVPLDPTYPAAHLAFMLDDARISFLLTQQKALTGLPDHAATSVCVDRDWARVAAEPADNPKVATTPRNLAYVIYTSGSTGLPKGVQIEHRGLCNVSAAQARAFGVRQGDRVLQFASLSFDASAFEIVMALTTGATLCLAPQETLLPGPNLARFLEESAISIVTLPPSALAAMPDGSFPALRVITVAGEACSADLVAKWAPGRQFFNLYGPTETTIWATCARCEAQPGKPSIGRPIDNTQAYLLDPALQPVPIGVPGELHLGGVGLARGYLNRPELTAEKFIRHPFRAEAEARLYKTGDLARYLADGSIEFLGRIDNQIKLRGFRIEPAEIETALIRHAGVRDAVVVAREDGSGDRRLVAYVVSEASTPRTAGELRGLLQKRLPEHMLPGVFVFLDALPLTPNGKVDRHALPAPERSLAAQRPAYAAPRTPMEETLAQLWSEVLDLPQVGIHDNFFTELGGHSLRATQLVSRLRTALQIDVPLRRLFEAPTIAGLAAAIVEQQAEEADQRVLAEVLEELRELPEDEVRAQLAAGAVRHSLEEESNG